MSEEISDNEVVVELKPGQIGLEGYRHLQEQMSELEQLKTLRHSCSWSRKVLGYHDSDGMVSLKTRGGEHLPGLTEEMLDAARHAIRDVADKDIAEVNDRIREVVPDWK